MKLVAIMPTYNQLEFIDQAIHSVIYQVDSLVVVNDGSTDGTEKYLNSVAKEYPFMVVIHQQNQGAAAAINAGYAFAHGADWVTWVSSDDWRAANWRSEFELAIEKDTGAVYSSYIRVTPHGSAIFSEPWKKDKLLNNTNCFFGPSFIIRKDVWDLAGNHRGKISHDYDHWLRVEEACEFLGLKIKHLNIPLCYYRVHDKRSTIVKRHEYDADKWQVEARARRANACH